MTTDGNTVRIQESVRTRAEMRERLKDLKKDYPRMDVDKEMEKVQDVERYSNAPWRSPQVW